MIKKLLLIVLSITSLIAEVDLSTAMLYKADITATQAYNMQQNGTLLIDTRTIREYRNLHAKGSINIPVFKEKNSKRVFNKNFVKKINSILNDNTNSKIILICRSGARTKLASNILAYNKFTNVYNVKSGFAYDWLKAKLPVEK
jgi:rhodanese-related sulfurtransferase